jgi:hypothetical protein
MRTASQLFPQVTAFANLCRAFRHASQGKQDQPDVQRFAYQLEDRLWDIKQDLEAETDTWGGYRSFWIYDPKKRLIKAAPFRDRIIHHALYNVLEPLYERSYIRDSYACLRGRGTLAAVRRYHAFVRRIGGTGYVLLGDIHQYFASVNHAVLKCLLRRKLRDRKLLRLLDSLIGTGDEGTGKGMPIGNLTSQLFANIYLDPFDHFIKEELGQKFYIRYMDDFVIMGRISEHRAVAERAVGIASESEACSGYPTIPRRGLSGVCHLSPWLQARPAAQCGARPTETTKTRGRICARSDFFCACS